MVSHHPAVLRFAQLFAGLSSAIVAQPGVSTPPDIVCVRAHRPSRVAQTHTLHIAISRQCISAGPGIRPQPFLADLNRFSTTLWLSTRRLPACAPRPLQARQPGWHGPPAPVSHRLHHVWRDCLCPLTACPCFLRLCRSFASFILCILSTIKLRTTTCSPRARRIVPSRCLGPFLRHAYLAYASPRLHVGQRR